MGLRVRDGHEDEDEIELGDDAEQKVSFRNNGRRMRKLGWLWRRTGNGGGRNGGKQSKKRKRSEREKKEKKERIG